MEFVDSASGELGMIHIWTYPLVMTNMTTMKISIFVVDFFHETYSDFQFPVRYVKLLVGMHKYECLFKA